MSGFRTSFGRRLRQAGELEEKLFLMVFVNMGVVDDVGRCCPTESAHLRDHADEGCVLRHVERHADPMSPLLDLRACRWKFRRPSAETSHMVRKAQG